MFWDNHNGGRDADRKIILQEAGIRAGEGEAHCLFVNGLHCRHPLAHIRATVKGQAFILEQIDRKDDIVSGKGFAVVPGNALAQDDIDTHIIGGECITFRQPGHHLATLIVEIEEALNQHTLTFAGTDCAADKGVKIFRPGDDIAAFAGND